MGLRYDQIIRILLIKTTTIEKLPRPPSAMLPPSSDLLSVPGGLLWIRVERSPSPQIQRALFQVSATEVQEVTSPLLHPVSPSTILSPQAGVSPLSSLTPRPRKRSARPSLDDDLQLFSRCPHQDKENQPSGRSGRKSSRRSEARPLTRSQDTSVFRFPDCGVSVAVDPAEDEQDEVFCAGAAVASPGSGRPLLTPSTAHTPWQVWLDTVHCTVECTVCSLCSIHYTFSLAAALPGRLAWHRHGGLLLHPQQVTVLLLPLSLLHCC